MLETLRKHHYILMCVITIVVIVAFVFLYDPNRQNLQGGQETAFRLYNKSFTVTEKREIETEKGMIEALSMMGRQNIRGMGEDLIGRYQMAHYVTLPNFARDLRQPQQRSDNNFVLCTVLVREEAARLGIEVETEDVKKALQTLPAFQKNGQFSKEAYDQFLNAPMMMPGSQPFGDRASTEKVLAHTVRDAMLWQKLEKMLAPDYLPTPVEVEDKYEERNVSITAAAVLIERKASENVAVTDEEVQKYYDAEKDKKIEVKKEAPPIPSEEEKDKKPSGPDPLLLSAEKRVVKYVYFPFPVDGPPPPDAPPDRSVPPMKPADPLPPVAPDTANLPEDQKKQKEDDYARQKAAFEEALKNFPAALAAWEQQIADYWVQHDIRALQTGENDAAKAAFEEKKKANVEAKKKLDEQAQALSDALVPDDGGKPRVFEDEAKKLSLEVKAPEAFAKDTAPADFKEDADLLTAMFRDDAKTVAHDLENGSYMTVSTPKGHCVYTVTKVEEPAIQPLEAVKVKLQEKLKKDKIDEALKKAAEETRTKLAEALKAGKTFQEAVAAAGPVAAATEVVTFTQSKPIDPKVPHNSTITQESRKLNPGEVSEPVAVPVFTPPPAPPLAAAAGALAPPPPQSLGEGMLLVWVQKKEMMDDPKKDEKKKAIAAELTKKQGPFSPTPLIKEWLNARLQDARAETPEGM